MFVFGQNKRTASPHFYLSFSLVYCLSISEAGGSIRDIYHERAWLHSNMDQVSREPLETLSLTHSLTHSLTYSLTHCYCDYVCTTGEGGAGFTLKDISR